MNNQDQKQQSSHKLENEQGDSKAKPANQNQGTDAAKQASEQSGGKSSENQK